jgi:hypothetical protein
MIDATAMIILINMKADTLYSAGKQYRENIVEVRKDVQIKPSTCSIPSSTNKSCNILKR